MGGRRGVRVCAAVAAGETAESVGNSAGTAASTIEESAGHPGAQAAAQDAGVSQQSPAAEADDSPSPWQGMDCSAASWDWTGFSIGPMPATASDCASRAQAASRLVRTRRFMMTETINLGLGSSQARAGVASHAILPAMNTRLRASLALLVALSVLGGRVAGVHAHFCLDGQEARSATHLADAGVHEQHDDSARSHLDVDRDIAEAWAKFAKSGLDSPVVVGRGGETPLLAATTRPAASSEAPFHPRFAHYFRPPLRGPPTLSL